MVVTIYWRFLILLIPLLHYYHLNGNGQLKWYHFTALPFFLLYLVEDAFKMTPTPEVGPFFRTSS